jgi:hypothetical protein
LSGPIGKKDEENESYGRKHSLGRDCDKLNEYGKQKLLRKNTVNTKKTKCSLVTKSIFKEMFKFPKKQSSELRHY